jgi:translation elongation factor EF-1beta
VKKATTIASTFAIALGIGFVMQYGDADAARYNVNAPVEIRDPVLLTDYSPLTAVDTFILKPDVNSGQAITTTANVSIDPDSVKLIALIEEADGVDGKSLFAQTQARAARASQCEILAVTAPNDTGSVIVTVVSRCRADMPFTVNHSGLSFSAQADAAGTAMLTIPALSEDATFFITFEDGKSLAASTYAPQASQYNRVVFQWEGHAGDYLQATGPDGTQIMLDHLGEDIGEIPRFAEVYSFPATTDVAAGLRDIDIVAHVTDENCGLDLIAESFSIFPGVVDLTFKDIRITLPNCDEVGATLELKKILGEQTLALR